MIRFRISPGFANETEKSILRRVGVSDSDLVFAASSPSEYRRILAEGSAVFGLIPDPSGFDSPDNENWPSGACLMEEGAETEDEYLRLVRARCFQIPYVAAVGERIYLRELWEGDKEEMVWLTGSEEERLEKIASYRTHVYLPWTLGIWGIFSKEDHRLLGRAGLEYDREGEVTLGYEVLEPYRRKGYALEAVLLALETFRRMDPDSASLRPVVVNISRDNFPSVSLIKKAERLSPLSLEIRLVQD